jgi:hypothetical protein
MKLTSALLGLAACLAVARAGSAAAEPTWNESTASAIAELGARLGPPDLARQVVKRFPSYRQGLREVLDLALTPGAANTAAAGAAAASAASANADREAAALVSAIRAHRSFDDVVYRSGRLAGWLAMANQPLAVADRDGGEPAFRADFLRFVESRRRRFALARDRRPDGTPSALVAAARRRGERYYDLIGREYRRVGGPDARGSELFDDRSTAFGVAALSFNHAMNDVAAALSAAWLQAGGADPRGTLATSGR